MSLYGNERETPSIR